MEKAAAALRAKSGICHPRTASLTNRGQGSAGVGPKTVHEDVPKLKDQT